MRSIRFICAFLATLTICSFAYADIITTFDFSNMALTENKGGTKIYGTVSGSVTIDVTTGAVESGDFTATYGATSEYGTPADTYTFTDISSATKTTGTSPTYLLTVFEDPSVPIYFDLEYLDNGGVITLCQGNTNGLTGNGACDQPGPVGEQTFLDSNFLGNGDEDLTTGTLVAATPEPASLWLLGTGLLGAVGVARKRLVRS